MGKIGSVLREILVWSYERGTLQYDIICALILAFIFFTPRSCLDTRKPGNSQAMGSAVSQSGQPAGDAQPPEKGN